MDQPFDKPKPIRDTRYYLGSVTILINNTIFKIPKQYFAKGLGVFGDVLPLPLNDPGADEASDDSPIYLNGISIKDFERLLEVMFPVYRPAIVDLKEIDPVDKIWLGKIFHMSSWLRDGYQTLAVREAAISENEGGRLGLNTVIRLSHAREAAALVKTGPKRQLVLAQRIQPMVTRELLDAEGARIPVWASTDRQSHRISLGSELAYHEWFYMVNIVFLVEGMLFKVPRASFERSELFATTFSLSNTENTVVDGSDDEHPFKLDGINKSDFQAFLEVLYPCKTSTQNQTTWTSTLKLSTMWDFFEIRDLAIQALSTMGMDPVSQVANSLQFNVPKWLFAGLKPLVMRQESISISEAKTLGLETAIRIYQIREEGLRGPLRNGSNLPIYAQSSGDMLAYCDFTESIRREFAEELRQAESEQGCR